MDAVTTTTSSELSAENQSQELLDKDFAITMRVWRCITEGRKATGYLIPKGGEGKYPFMFSDVVGVKCRQAFLTERQKGLIRAMVEEKLAQH